MLGYIGVGGSIIQKLTLRFREERIPLAQSRVEWQAVVMAMMKLWVP
jgi:hypothetical protein